MVDKKIENERYSVTQAQIAEHNRSYDELSKKVSELSAQRIDYINKLEGIISAGNGMLNWSILDEKRDLDAYREFQNRLNEKWDAYAKEADFGKAQVLLGDYIVEYGAIVSDSKKNPRVLEGLEIDDTFRRKSFDLQNKQAEGIKLVESLAADREYEIGATRAQPVENIRAVMRFDIKGVQNDAIRIIETQNTANRQFIDEHKDKVVTREQTIAAEAELSAAEKNREAANKTEDPLKKTAARDQLDAAKAVVGKQVEQLAEVIKTHAEALKQEGAEKAQIANAASVDLVNLNVAIAHLPEQKQEEVKKKITEKVGVESGAEVKSPAPVEPAAEAPVKPRSEEEIKQQQEQQLKGALEARLEAIKQGHPRADQDFRDATAGLQLVDVEGAVGKQDQAIREEKNVERIAAQAAAREAAKAAAIKEAEAAAAKAAAEKAAAEAKAAADAKEAAQKAAEEQTARVLAAKDAILKEDKVRQEVVDMVRNGQQYYKNSDPNQGKCKETVTIGKGHIEVAELENLLKDPAKKALLDVNKDGQWTREDATEIYKDKDGKVNEKAVDAFMSTMDKAGLKTGEQVTPGTSTSAAKSSEKANPER